MPPSLNFGESEVQHSHCRILSRTETAAIEVALSNSFGFGGTNAALCFSKV